MNANDTRELSIRVKCGKAERELTFPIPEEMREWLERIELPGQPQDNDNPLCYTIEGNRSIQITLTVFDVRRKF